jgi:hypothetical protein
MLGSIATRAAVVKKLISRIYKDETRRASRADFLLQISNYGFVEVVIAKLGITGIEMDGA